VGRWEQIEPHVSGWVEETPADRVERTLADPVERRLADPEDG
jgi:hypothetical protein